MFGWVFSAQAWHWVRGADRYEKAARRVGAGRNARRVLEHRPRPPGTVQDRQRRGLSTTRAGAHRLDRRSVEAGSTPRRRSIVCGAFEPMDERTVTWRTSYTSAEWMRSATHKLTATECSPTKRETCLHSEIGATHRCARRTVTGRLRHAHLSRETPVDSLAEDEPAAVLGLDRHRLGHRAVFDVDRHAVVAG